jgi:hypothetical protein
MPTDGQPGGRRCDIVPKRQSAKDLSGQGGNGGTDLNRKEGCEPTIGAHSCVIAGDQSPKPLRHRIAEI